MATVGAKNQPIVQTTDTFNPVADINTLSNWVANNYASVKIIASPNTRTSVTGADLFAGLLVWEQTSGQFWLYNGSAWVLQPIGTPPRIELTRTTDGTSFFANNTATTLTGWTATMNRGGFTESSGTVTVPVAGRYNITGAFGFQAMGSPAGYRQFAINLNGTSQVYRNTMQPFASVLSYGVINATGVQLAANDTVALVGLQTQGSAINLTASASGLPAKLIIEYVGA